MHHQVLLFFSSFASEIGTLVDVPFRPHNNTWPVPGRPCLHHPCLACPPHPAASRAATTTLIHRGPCRFFPYPDFKPASPLEPASWGAACRTSDGETDRPSSVARAPFRRPSPRGPPSNSRVDRPVSSWLRPWPLVRTVKGMDAHGGTNRDPHATGRPHGPPVSKPECRWQGSEEGKVGMAGTRAGD